MTFGRAQYGMGEPIIGFWPPWIANHVDCRRGTRLTPTGFSWRQDRRLSMKMPSDEDCAKHD
jgi:hypothetical protein